MADQQPVDARRVRFHVPPRFMTRREFQRCRRNLTFEQCVYYGVDPDSRLFRAHRYRHEMLRVWLRMGVTPWSEQQQANIPGLSRVLRQRWDRCLRELERY
ncbi:hypothetical protein CAEBREN_23898 [Caenorhabditis brenneri]|uniref:Uncharacterized protein n=1 Tax=Caenorhabditis brenneri TaxID=135651 RepID=G0MXD7_CAEBE|nr:hypothetical protein CAEBREN_23898 [Caenorhabditis brenneri]